MGLNHTELLTLVAIARLGDEAYGVTIRDEIASCTGRTPSLAAIYAALDRLEERRLAEAWLSEPIAARGGRARRQFRLTADGRWFVSRERANALRMWRGVKVVPDGEAR